MTTDASNDLNPDANPLPPLDALPFGRRDARAAALAASWLGWALFGWLFPLVGVGMALLAAVLLFRARATLQGVLVPSVLVVSWAGGQMLYLSFQTQAPQLAEATYNVAMVATFLSLVALQDQWRRWIAMGILGDLGTRLRRYIAYGIIPLAWLSVLNVIAQLLWHPSLPLHSQMPPSVWASSGLPYGLVRAVQTIGVLAMLVCAAELFIGLRISRSLWRFLGRHLKA